MAHLQQGIIGRMTSDPAPLLTAAAFALATARGAGMVVVHARIAVIPGHSQVSSRNKMLAPLLKGGFMIEGSEDAMIHAAVAPSSGEVVVTNQRVGAFAATDLEQLFRARQIEHLVLAGYATSGVILTTIRDAADRDYELTVLSDAVADNDSELHEVLIRKLFPRQAEVIDTAAFAAAVT